MKEKSILNKVRTLLGMEIKLESMTLSDGITILDAEIFEAGQEVFIVTPDEQKIAVPIGEYELEDMRVLVVAEEGIIAEIKEAVSEEAVVPEVAVVQEVLSQKVTAPKKEITTSSTTREKHFSTEEVEVLKKEIEELKKEIEELKVKIAGQVEEVKEVAPIELSEKPKPISYNPENKKEVSIFRISPRANRTTLHSIMEKISNI